jgi:hypothetical protein
MNETNPANNILLDIARPFQRWTNRLTQIHSGISGCIIILKTGGGKESEKHKTGSELFSIAFYRWCARNSFQRDGMCAMLMTVISSHLLSRSAPAANMVLLPRVASDSEPNNECPWRAMAVRRVGRRRSAAGQ